MGDKEGRARGRDWKRREGRRDEIREGGKVRKINRWRDKRRVRSGRRNKEGKEK